MATNPRLPTSSHTPLQYAQRELCFIRRTKLSGSDSSLRSAYGGGTMKVATARRREEFESAAPGEREPNPWPTGLKAPYCPIPSRFLELIGTLGLTPIEALIIIQLHDFKRRTNGVAYPAMETLAGRVGRSIREVRRVMASLEQKGFVVRVPTFLNSKRTNEYNMEGLYSHIRELAKTLRHSGQDHADVAARDSTEIEPPF